MAVIWQTKSASVAVAGLLTAQHVVAAELTIQVTDRRSPKSTIYAAVCPRDKFLQPDCAFSGLGTASSAVAAVAGVPSRTYAVQVVHDENDNRLLDDPGFLPTIGMSFSRDTPMRLGPMQFADAKFELAQLSATVPVTKRYFQ